MSAATSIAPSLLPASAITKGRLCERVTSAGVELVQHYNAANTVGNAQRFAGVAAETHDGTGTRFVSLYGPGQFCDVTTGAAITAAHFFLTSDAAGKLVVAVDGDIIVAHNQNGVTAAGADETIRVLVVNPHIWDT